MTSHPDLVSEAKAAVAAMDEERKHSDSMSGDFGFRKAGNACIAYVRALPESAGGGECHWSQQDDGYSCYSTGCGQEFEVNDGSPSWPYCCFCAKPMKVVAWSEGGDE